MIDRMARTCREEMRVDRRLSLRMAAVGLICFGWMCGASPARSAGLDVESIRKAAVGAKSRFLGEAGRVQAVELFQRLVLVEGVSGDEERIREEVRGLLTAAGARVVAVGGRDGDAPYNLVMEIPGSGALAGRPGILLNAHLDTIGACTPEFMAFDEKTGDFYHLHEGESGKSSSFGGDDRSGVAVIVETVRLMQLQPWSDGAAHRRILLVFTADEERGFVGAKYLREHARELFADIEISLTLDGPLDFRSNYPRNSFVLVVSERDAAIMPYKRVIALTEAFCERAGFRFGTTEIGLGMGDFAQFPASAHAGLHLRSAVRGFHREERVNVQDLINQIDLLCHLLLSWDHGPSLGEGVAGGGG